MAKLIFETRRFHRRKKKLWKENYQKKWIKNQWAFYGNHGVCQPHKGALSHNRTVVVSRPPLDRNSNVHRNPWHIRQSTKTHAKPEMPRLVSRAFLNASMSMTRTGYSWRHKLGLLTTESPPPIDEEIPVRVTDLASATESPVASSATIKIVTRTKSVCHAYYSLHLRCKVGNTTRLAFKSPHPVHKRGCLQKSASLETLKSCYAFARHKYETFIALFLIIGAYFTGTGSHIFWFLLKVWSITHMSRHRTIFP